MTPTNLKKTLLSVWIDYVLGVVLVALYLHDWASVFDLAWSTGCVLLWVHFKLRKHFNP